VCREFKKVENHCIRAIIRSQHVQDRQEKYVNMKVINEVKKMIKDESVERTRQVLKPIFINTYFHFDKPVSVFQISTVNFTTFVRQAQGLPDFFVRVPNFKLISFSSRKTKLEVHSLSLFVLEL
jgi:hypothetical protein